MTNAEKFKTPVERMLAFNNFCSNGQCDKCSISREFGVGGNCKFVWLDLEYTEGLEKCPFCGAEASICSGTEDHYVLCSNKDCAAALVARSFSSAEEAIDAWNRRVR